MNELTVDEARRLFDYNPDTGVLRWRVTSGPRARAGNIAGCKTPYGYTQVQAHGHFHRIHRLVWFMTHGVWPTYHIDHIDGDRSNNRIKNLRDIPNAANHQNIHRANRGNSTGLLGAYPNGNGWMAKICLNGNKMYLGTFPSPEEAHSVYLKAKSELHPFWTGEVRV